MRRTRQRFILVTMLGTSLSATALAQTGPLDARSLRPAVMLLVDTSGSMERVPDDGSNPDCDSCVPTCTGDTMVDRNSKTRWALTIEALTGTIQNYTCELQDRSRSPYAPDWYDYGYYLPHINFNVNGGLVQATDGILDSFASRVKFGLMTFDGVGTMIGGDTLIGPYSDWWQPISRVNPAVNGSLGMYSYGDPGRLAFPGCPTDYGINAGARGPDAQGPVEITRADGSKITTREDQGGLVAVPSSDTLDVIMEANTKIQRSLVNVRPYGGTPIAAMLEDLRYYLEHDPNVLPYSSTNTAGDVFHACRPRKAILITDGAPDAMFRDSRFRCDVEESLTDPNIHIDTGLCAVSNTHQDNDRFNFDRGCSCPYKAPTRTAAELTGQEHAPGHETLLEKLIVVAYNVHDATALRTLDGIGQAAGFSPTAAVQDSTYRHLIIADGAGDLRRKIEAELNVAPLGGSSRSVMVSVNVGDPSVPGSSKRFDISAGFQTGANTADPWAGYLFRGRAICGSSGPHEEQYSRAEGDSFHDVLTAQSASNQRTLYTATPSVYGPVDGSLVNDNYSPVLLRAGDGTYQSNRLPTSWDSVNDRRPDGRDFTSADRVSLDSTPILSQGRVTNNVSSPTTPNFVDSTVLDAAYFGDATGDNVPGTPADRTAVVNYTLGRGRPNALADIYHSQPNVLLPVNQADIQHLTTIDGRYTSWLRALMNPSSSPYDAGGRPGVVFVGTNDGVLHAFNLDRWTNRGTTIEAGRELWGFVPPALFGKMASMLDAHQTGFDASPQVKDVVLQSRSGSTPIFRTILVSALRGAHAYIALDVTFPEAPVFLWQFSAPDVGNTIGDVGLTQVNINWPGIGEMVRAVAILPGGEGIASSACANGARFTPEAGKTRAQFPSGNDRDVRCWTRRGRGLYVVDVATGQLIQQFGFEHFPSPMTGAVAVENPGVGTSAAAYMFDHDGILWRLSMVSTDPSNWKVTPIYDMFMDPPAPKNTEPAFSLGRRPLYAPTLTRDTFGNLVIVAGTGDLDSPFDNATNRVVSLTEKRNGLQDREIAADIVLNWRIDLRPWEAVTGPLTLFQDTIYFATSHYTDSSDQCATGESTRWGVHAYKPVDVSGGVSRPLPRLKRMDANNTDPLVESEAQSGGQLLVGLTVRQQPVCQSSGFTTNAITQQRLSTGSATGGGYELIGMTSSGSAGSTAHATDGSVIGTVSQSTPQVIQATHTSKVTSWTSMFE